MAAHSTLTGSDLHEPKGVSAASINTAYIADGAGSGAWQKIDDDAIDTTSIFNTNKGIVTGVIADVSTASDIMFVFPFDVTITRVTTLLAGAISGADAGITVTKTGGLSLGTLTITQSGSAEGDVDQLTPASNNVLTPNQWLKVATDGASTDTESLYVTIEYTRGS